MGWGLRVVDQAGRPTADVPRDEAGFVLGRDLVARLGLPADTTVSRQHAEVVERDGALVVRDLDSRNGTRVNGERIQGPTRLRPGDVVEVGPYRFQVHDDEGTDVTSVFLHATAAATRAGAPERLRLVYGLTRLVSDGIGPREVARRLAEVIGRTLPGTTVAVWLPQEAEPIGEARPFSAELVRRHVIDEGRVLRHPAGNAPQAIAFPLAPEPSALGALVAATPAGRRFAADDVDFLAAAAALTGEALRRGHRLSALALRATDDEILGDSPEIGRARREVDLVAPHTDVSVLLIGETGVGKELFARRVHRLSGRAGPLVAVNMAAIPAELMEGELFGHVKGAFTGAHGAREGYFEYARGGTLFLDEIGEMPATLQAKLLRVLEDRRMTRLGDPRPVEVDVRIVAATNVHLEAQMQRGAFRRDLYYRLAGKEVRIPPLRDRTGDLPLLVEAFLRRNLGRSPRPVTTVRPDAMATLVRAPWPGNVRQLEGTIRLAVIHAAGDGSPEIRPEHLDPRVTEAAETAPASLSEELAAAERRVVVKALRRAGGNKREASRLLEWSINTLRDRLERHAIAPSEYGARPEPEEA